MRSLRIVSGLAALALVVVPAAFAGDFGIVAGGTYADRDIDGEDRPLGPTVGLQLGFQMGEHSRWNVDGTWSPLETSEGQNDFTLLTLRTGPEYFLSKSVFLAPAVGLMWLDEEKSSEGDANRGLVSLGLGQRFGGPSNDGFSWQVRATHSLGSSGFDGHSLLNYEGLLGYAWGGPPKDEDGDGVGDRKDKCPGTPAGAIVDEKGCPKDADGDGVFDGLDKCPGTPKGYPVDAAGCPLDSDGDGVLDGADRCPDTPRGATVDATGCPKDSDGDRVFDGLDKCPGTPPGTAVDPSGCPLDSDGDGVPDNADKCPGTPRGTRVDANGCPPDSDGDGVPDSTDRCPGTPPGTKVDATGCPEKEAIAKLLVLEGVTFETNKAVLRPQSKATLDDMARRLKEFPEVRVQVNGHTDSVGSDALNQRLSEARAKSVRDYLVGQGVPASQLSAKGFGEKRPVASNDTEEGRAQNRRVELERLN